MRYILYKGDFYKIINETRARNDRKTYSVGIELILHV